MQQHIPESELILNPDGSVYHLNLHPEELADTVIIVGDPDRVPVISKYFDNIEVKKHKREITTHTGYYGGKRLTVMSTGMGTDSIDIVINELDALVNIDLKSRTIKKDIKSLNIIRFGTSGALHADIPLNSYLVSTHGVGLDILMHYYDWQPSREERALTDAFIDHIGDDGVNLKPYITKGCEKLIEHFADDCIEGMTATGAGFYAPQGRVLRYKLATPGLIDKLPGFIHKGHRITNFEMETSAIYGLGHRVLGHSCCSVNLIVANRANKTFTATAHESMDKMIQMGLEKLRNL